MAGKPDSALSPEDFIKLARVVLNLCGVGERVGAIIGLGQTTESLRMRPVAAVIVAAYSRSRRRVSQFASVATFRVRIYLSLNRSFGASAQSGGSRGGAVPLRRSPAAATRGAAVMSGSAARN